MKRFIGDKVFYMTTLSIALPIMLQQFITTFVNLIDNIMIGSIGGIALTSVTVANRYYMIFNSMLFGVCGAAAIYVAQFYGAKKNDKCQEVFNMILLWVLVLAIAFISVLFIAPEMVIKIFTDTPEIVSESLKYIEYAKYAYLPNGISYAIMLAMRSIGINKVQLKVGSIAVLTNTILNYLLIFGNFGFPEMGIQGAAIATVCARLIEMMIYIVILCRHKHFFNLDIKGIFTINKTLMASVMKKALPLTFNEIMYSLGISAIFLSYMRTDEYLVSAIAVVDTVTQILFIIFGGLSSAVSIMIGKKLGANELSEAKDNANKLIVFGVMVAIIVGIVAFIIAKFIPEFYNLDQEIKNTITILIRIKSVSIILHVVNVCTFFILRAGGDIVSTLILDSGMLWVGGVLVSTILSMYTSIPLITLYLFVEACDAVKLFFSLYFFKKGQWIKNITAM